MEKQSSEPQTTSNRQPLDQPTATNKQALNTLIRKGQSLAGNSLRISNAVARQALHWLEAGTHGAGQAVTLVGRLPLVRRFAGVLRLDWLVGINDRIDLKKVKSQAQQLQQRYPQDSPSQLAHRIMVQKAIQAGGIGFASSILPGFAAAMFAVDLAATTALQTAMVYEIAAVYGMDLQEASRKGEVLGIFGLALGGRNALKAGLGFLRNVPLAGAMIGMGTNVTMLYSLGYGARRYYETKLNTQAEPGGATLQAIQRESEQYLETAIAQQALCDQILAHMAITSYPNRHWQDILPELQRLHLDVNSLQAIAHNLKTPRPLDSLVEQLDCDYAAPLLFQCQRLADLDGSVSAAERGILDAIRDKCNPEDLKE